MDVASADQDIRVGRQCRPDLYSEARDPWGPRPPVSLRMLLVIFALLLIISPAPIWQSGLSKDPAATANGAPCGRQRPAHGPDNGSRT